MEVEISHVEFQEEHDRILVTVSYGEEQPDETWNRATAAVFIPWFDSYEEIKRVALEKAKEFLLHAASDR
jgi:hypothetical protein